MLPVVHSRRPPPVAARRCEVPQSTWADWEAGTSSPSVERLGEVLQRIDLDLRIDDRPPPEPPGESQVARHLRRSLTERARTALGDHLEGALAACRAGTRLLTGPAAIGVWVPYAVARACPPLPPAPRNGPHVILRLDRGEPLTGPALAAVVTPAALISVGAADAWPLLSISARLLAEGGRDLVGRRLPPHRDPDEARETYDLVHTLTGVVAEHCPSSPPTAVPDGWTHHRRSMLSCRARGSRRATPHVEVVSHPDLSCRGPARG